MLKLEMLNACFIPPNSKHRIQVPNPEPGSPTRLEDRGGFVVLVVKCILATQDLEFSYQKDFFFE